MPLELRSLQGRAGFVSSAEKETGRRLAPVEPSPEGEGMERNVCHCPQGEEEEGEKKKRKEESRASRLLAQGSILS
ncbi:hypothetical protein JCGZ_09869 [Jatropha curcas]|uniref:Uncharacterized protein n=1 Tax=Jatropha curcas TaxID=180498 RepID=A0A067KIF1_JATCU|nr:hypothetical protein JCGZ_09869 [Jatropha curcas]